MKKFLQSGGYFLRFLTCMFLFLLILTMPAYSQELRNSVQVAEDIKLTDQFSGIQFNLPPVAPTYYLNKVMAPLSGTYTIGTALPGPTNYLTLNAAVADLQTQGVSGPVIFEFTDLTYTDTSVVIGGYAGQGVANPVVFRKATSVASVKITFTGLRTFGIRLDSASYVSFIGSTVVGTRPITLEVDSAFARNPFVISKSNNIRLEGLEVIGFRRASDNLAASIIAQASTVGSTTPNTNIVYTNLLLKRGSVCISANGISNANRDNNVTISYCDFGGDTFLETFSSRGVSVFAIDNLTIYKNDIRRGKNFAIATTGPAGIILFGGHNNLVISHNLIHDLEKFGTLGGQPTGIRIQTNGPGVYTNARVFNNMVYDLRNSTGVNPTATQGTEGIAVTSTSPNSFNVAEVYNNTIHLTGSLSATTPSYIAAMLFSTTLATDTVKVFNNIISNEMVSPGGTGSFIYADFIHQTDPANLRQVSDYNLYWYPGNSLSIFSGADLAEWQTNTLQDANSIEQVDPKFVSTTNPHININQISPADSNAIPVAYITDDIDLSARSLTVPDIGADEYTYVAPPVLDPAAFAATATSTTQISLTFTPNGSGNNVVIVWNTTGIFTTPSGAPPSSGSPFAGGTLLSNGTSSPQNHTGLTSNTLYYYKAFSYNGTLYSGGLTANATTFCDPLTLPYSQSFDGGVFEPDCWSLVNAGAGNPWTRTTAGTFAGAGAMRYTWDAINPANAWAFTPGFILESGKTYRVSFYQKVDNEDDLYAEKMKVTVGTLPTVAAQTTTIWNNAGGTNLTNTTYIKRNADFVCPANGTYYFAFNSYSDADQFNLYVDEVSIFEKPLVDLSLNEFYQATGLPVPRPGENFSNYSISMNKNSENEDIPSLLQLNNENKSARSTDVNNTIVVVNKKVAEIELANVSIEGVIENGGLNSASYNLNWAVDGSGQPTFNGPTVSPLGIDTATVTYTPAQQGTFLTTGNIVVSGDLVSSNDSSQFRMRIYPDSYTRTIYDRGDNFVDTHVGWGSLIIPMKAGVRFTATSEYQLGGVDFICRTEAVTSGQIIVQVRAAGTDTLAPGAVLYTQIYSSEGYLASGEIGDYIYFPFGNDAPTIASGSDYWITVKFPVGILFPGAVHSTGFTTAGRSFFEGNVDTTLWNPLVVGTERAWIMRSVNLSEETTTFNLTVNVSNSWNMVSAPGMHPTNQNVTTWWTGKDPGANVFKYSGGYSPVTTTDPGEGYWMKNVGAQTYVHNGVIIVAHDPIAGATGWNLIGPYDVNVLTSGITTTPGGLVQGSVFGYSGGYFAADTLKPGYGYWIKLSGAGTINLPSSLAKGTPKIAELINQDWGKIIITDASGKGYTLYAVDGEVNLNMFELPPVPPAGVFDVRYGSGRYAEEINESSQLIEMNGLVYPVTVQAEGIAIRLQDETGRVVNERLKSGEKITINGGISKLLASKDIIPDKYALEQNYPNPFNPSTVIEFSIPENAKNVSLTIYNALGEKVTELINGSFEAGVYEYQWNAVNLSSGLYIYELRTEKFVSVKKMMFLK